MKHFWQSIVGYCGYGYLLERAVAAAPDPAVFVEIGCYLGRSTAYLAVEIANSGKRIEHHCIDPWTDKGVSTYELFMAYTAPVRDRLHIHRAKSPGAASLFAAGSVDFVFVDGDHDYEGVRADIVAWLPKLKSGGVIAGDDHTAEYPGVRRAVAELLPKAEICNSGICEHWWWRRP